MTIAIGSIVLACTIPLLITLLLLFRKKPKIPIAKASPQNIRLENSVSPEKADFDGSAVEAVRFEGDGGCGFLVNRLSERAAEARKWKALPISSESEAWLTTYLNHASEFLGAPIVGLSTSARKYKLVFDGAGELMRSKAGDGFRPILIDRHSRQIVSHATLKGAGHSAATSVILWECAATIVGRKYLADIDRRLSAIENGIASLRAFLENQRIGTLQADCRNIAEYSAALKRDPSFVYKRQNVQHLIDVMDRNASGVVRSCLLDMDNARREVDCLSLTAISSVDLSEVEQSMSTAVQTLQIAALALGIRQCCAALLNSYMEDTELRQSKLRDCADLWYALNQSSMDFQRALNSKLDSLKEYLSFRETEQEKKSRAKQRSNALFLEAARALKSAKDDLGRIKADSTVFSALSKPIELAVTMGKDGEILETLVATHA